MADTKKSQNKNVFNPGFSDSLKSDLYTEKIRIKDTAISSFKPKLFEDMAVLQKVKNQSNVGYKSSNSQPNLIEFRKDVVSIARIESRPLSAHEIYNILLKKRSLARKNYKLKLQWVEGVLMNTKGFAGLMKIQWVSLSLFVATDEKDKNGNTRFKLDLDSCKIINV